MTRIPPHSGKDAIKILVRNGFTVDHQTGSHVYLWKDGLARPVIVPNYKELPPHIVNQIRKALKMSRKDYKKAL